MDRRDLPVEEEDEHSFSGTRVKKPQLSEIGYCVSPSENLDSPQTFRIKSMISCSVSFICIRNQKVFDLLQAIYLILKQPGVNMPCSDFADSTDFTSVHM